MSGYLQRIIGQTAAESFTPFVRSRSPIAELDQRMHSLDPDALPSQAASSALGYPPGSVADPSPTGGLGATGPAEIQRKAVPQAPTVLEGQAEQVAQPMDTRPSLADELSQQSLTTAPTPHVRSSQKSSVLTLEQRPAVGKEKSSPPESPSLADRGRNTPSPLSPTPPKSGSESEKPSQPSELRPPVSSAAIFSETSLTTAANTATTAGERETLSPPESRFATGYPSPLLPVAQPAKRSDAEHNSRQDVSELLPHEPPIPADTGLSSQGSLNRRDSSRRQQPPKAQPRVVIDSITVEVVTPPPASSAPAPVTAASASVIGPVSPRFRSTLRRGLGRR